MKHNAKVRIWVRDKWRCQYCGIKLTMDSATVDHVIPRQLGGTNHPDNLKTSCRSCNLNKGIKEEIRSIIY